MHVLNENDRILIQISLTIVFRCPINNKATLVQIMASRQIGDKPLSAPMLTHVCGRSVNGMFLLIDLDKHAECMIDIMSSLNRNGICQCIGVIVFFSTPNHYLNQLWFRINEERTSVDLHPKPAGIEEVICKTKHTASGCTWNPLCLAI